MGLRDLIMRALMPPQPAGGIKKEIAQADKVRADRQVFVEGYVRSVKAHQKKRVKGYVRTLAQRKKNYQKQTEAAVRTLASQIKAGAGKQAGQPASEGKTGKKSIRRSGARRKKL